MWVLNAVECVVNVHLGWSRVGLMADKDMTERDTY